MLRFRAKPFPDPVGIIANVVSVFIKDLPISLTEPSPPTATITLYLSAFFVLNSIACLALLVYLISTSNLFLSRCLLTDFSTIFCFPIPEIGLIINNIFCLGSIIIILRQIIDY